MDSFAQFAEHPDFHFRLGVDVGSDITHDELAAHHHAVVYAVGAPNDRRLGIPGEDLPGSHSAAEFVAWYNGHPDHAAGHFDLSAERAVIIGNGNVALDIARVLLTDPDSLASTDIADHALETLRNSNIREIVIVGRRGPGAAAFTTPELRALAGLPGVDIATDTIDALLAARDIAPIDNRGWRAIDAHERELGRARGRTRVKQTSIETIEAIAKSGV